MKNEIKNEFVWNLSEESWKKYPEEMKDALEIDGCFNTAGVVGCCRIGDLCFDFRGWGDVCRGAIGYELYVGGVDTGYCKTQDGYPYDWLLESGEFDLGVLDMSIDQFKRVAEPVLRDFIIKANDNYDLADLVEKANEPLHVW